MISECIKSIITSGASMSKKRDTHTLGWRVATERKKSGLTQAQLVELVKEHGITMSVTALSQIELDETTRVRIDYLLAIANKLGVDICYLITGEEHGETISYSAEAEEVARMVDEMLPRSRLSMQVIAKNLVEADKKDRRKDIEITRFLQSLDQSLTYLTDSQRSEIADILHNLDAGNGGNHRGYSNGQSAP